jgi:hypothetical protein
VELLEHSALIVFGLFPSRDVELNTLVSAGSPLIVVRDHGGYVVKPHDPTILGEHPILHLEGLAGLDRSSRLADHFRSIIGVQGIDPQRRGRHPLFGTKAKDLFDLGAHELLDDVVEAALHAPDVDDGGNLLDESSEPRLQFSAIAVRLATRPVFGDCVSSPSRAERMQCRKTYERTISRSIHVPDRSRSRAYRRVA